MKNCVTLHIETYYTIENAIFKGFFEIFTDFSFLNKKGMLFIPFKVRI